MLSVDRCRYRRYSARLHILSTVNLWRQTGALEHCHICASFF
ncbi:hypothetical protein [Zymomonas mobilis]|nr:hypothetical protein [Zymomonas mobilis]